MWSPVKWYITWITGTDVWQLIKSLNSWILQVAILSQTETYGASICSSVMPCLPTSIFKYWLWAQIYMPYITVNSFPIGFTCPKCFLCCYFCMLKEIICIIGLWHHSIAHWLAALCVMQCTALALQYLVFTKCTTWSKTRYVQTQNTFSLSQLFSFVCWECTKCKGNKCWL